MIRHANRSLALAIGARAILMIEAAFLRLLMAAIGGAVLNPASELAAGGAAIDLSPLTSWTNEEDNAATRSLAEALPERSVTVIRHVESRSGWTAETEGRKMHAS
ncbi:MAG: hypothetical protein ACREEM_51740 [Blastocatellia bacterium]